MPHVAGVNAARRDLSDAANAPRPGDARIFLSSNHYRNPMTTKPTPSPLDRLLSGDDREERRRRVNERARLSMKILRLETQAARMPNCQGLVALREEIRQLEIRRALIKVAS